MWSGKGEGSRRRVTTDYGVRRSTTTVCMYGVWYGMVAGSFFSLLRPLLQPGGQEKKKRKKGKRKGGSLGDGTPRV